MTVEKVFKINTPTQYKFSKPQNQSSEVHEDYAVKKVLNTQEGTIEKTPVDPSDIVNKAYVDAGGGVNTTYNAGAPVTLVGTTFSMPAADTDTDGYISQTDWDTFNDKISYTAGTTVAANASFRVTPSTVITAGDNISWSGNTLNVSAGGAGTTDHSGLYNLTYASSGHIGFVDADDYNTHVASTAIHYIESSIDHINIDNVGTNTHAQIDTHIGSTAIHFIEGGIDHVNIQSIGSNTHAQLDTHVGSTAIHYVESGIDHVNITSVGSNTHAQIDTHVGSAAIHYVQGSISIPASQVSDFDAEVTNNITVSSSATHFNGDGSDHADVASNTTHKSSNGTDHANVVTNDTHVAGDGSDHADVASNTTHRTDNSQAHSDYLINNASDSTSGTLTAAGFNAGSGIIQTTGSITTGDHGTATTDQVVNVCYGTSATPPTASTTTEGALYVQYTA